MCGIAGVIKIHDPKDGPPPPPLEAIPEQWLDILDESIKHRGPDGQGRFRDRATREDGTIVDVALVHRRLSIIDHEGGHQPMVHDGDRLRADLTYQPGEPPIVASEVEPGKPLVAVVFNGCIYNHRELRRELEGQGCVFETDHSDTEVLVHGWRVWGGKHKIELSDRGDPDPGIDHGLFEHLEGMWGYTCWSGATGDFQIGNDRHREKPVWLFNQSAPLIFSSSFVGIERVLQQALPHLKRPPGGLTTRNIIAGPMLIHSYNDIERLYDSFGTKGIENDWFTAPSHHWYLNQRPRPNQIDRRIEQPSPDLIDDLIKKGVTTRLDADVPVGIFLSGGIDSALIAAHSRAHDPGIKAYTVRMPQPEYDESHAAAETARELGIEHSILDCSPNPAQDLITLIETTGVPFGDSSLLPTYWLSKEVRKEVRVALSGDGGDELFAGYQRHQIAGVLKANPGLCKLIPSLMLSQKDPRSRWTKLARLGRAGRSDGYRSLLKIFQDQDIRHLLGKQWDFSQRVTPFNLGFILSEMLLSTLFSGERARENGLYWALEEDYQDYLPNDLLFKTDTASMQVALEVRCPLLDSELVSIARNAILTILMPNGERKGLLKQVARKYLPDHIVDRPKQGFAIPIGEWFRTDYGGMRQLLYDHLHSADPFPGLAESGVELNMKFVEQMLKEHDAAGEKSINPWHGRDHSQRLYMLLVLSIWAKWLERVRKGSEQIA